VQAFHRLHRNFSNTLVSGVVRTGSELVTALGASVSKLHGGALVTVLLPLQPPSVGPATGQSQQGRSSGVSVNHEHLSNRRRQHVSPIARGKHGSSRCSEKESGTSGRNNSRTITYRPPPLLTEPDSQIKYGRKKLNHRALVPFRFSVLKRDMRGHTIFILWINAFDTRKSSALHRSKRRAIALRLVFLLYVM